MMGNRPDQVKRKVDRQRRMLLGLAAAGGLSAIASPWMFQSSRAAPRVVKIGMVSPETGAIAAFGEADQFVLASVRKALGDGIVIAGEKHPIQIICKDSQSNPNRAAEVTAQLINNDKVDLVVGSSTSDTVIPVSDQCELAGVPCITSDDPWQIWFFGRKGDPKKGFEWTYHFFWGLDQLGDIFADMWLALPTNKVLGTLWSNDGDGINANAHLPDFFKSKGFDVHNLGLYANNADDFSAQIADLKKANCEIVSGVFTPPEFGIFWTQCAQQGYRPKVVTPAKALLFPAAVEALGDRGGDLSTEVWWSHHHPFKSGLSGETALQFCDAYTAATGKQWNSADRLQARQSRSRDRCPQAHKKARARRNSRRDCRHQLPVPGRSCCLERRAQQSRAERMFDAAGRRAMEERQEVQVRLARRLQSSGAEHRAR